jgi:predicted acylesterase/phospholipase RssA
MKKLGLALSGGGFRATLYHLGLVRFLRDAGVLSEVSHITSVSGGSIFAAHLVLNWDRYNGSPNEFDSAASELLAFVRLDVRNRIARRFPLTMPIRWARRLIGRSNRKLTRTGLLEYHYEKFLYGDISLFQLPETPRLHLLATNLSEGCLCSFDRDGLLMMRPQAGYALRIDRIHVGLATVPMAVTASSAFPGFFPPLELTGAIVGARGGEFGRQAYTDGGVFDNLGVRMFRCLERPLLADSPLAREDFYDLPAIIRALRQASKSSEQSPLKCVAQVLVAPRSQQGTLLLTDAEPATDSPVSSAAMDNGAAEEFVLSSLDNAIRHHQFHHEPLFASTELADTEAAALLQSSRIDGKVLNPVDQIWLNRHLLEAAFRQSTGRACFRRLNSGLDGVLVSDVGKPIEVLGHRRAGGLIRTSLRASDILMDRVWQLEKETFHEAPGFVFAPITEVVEPTEDATALHPEVQRQTADIRTDMDRFSDLEISSLARHGYCVGRKACRARSDLFGDNLPTNAPWDPVSLKHGTLLPAPLAPRLGQPSSVPKEATVEARTLQKSAFRRIWSTLLDPRDWVSYIYVPLLVPILCVMPYLIVKAYERSQRMNLLIDSLSQASPDLEHMSRLLEGQVSPWKGLVPEEVRDLSKPDFRGFTVLQDSNIFDLRAWKSPAETKNENDLTIYGVRRLKIQKLLDNSDNHILSIDIITHSPRAQIRFPSQRVRPKLFMRKLENPVDPDISVQWIATIDFSKVPVGDLVDFTYEHYTPGKYLRFNNGSTTMIYDVETPTAELTRWMLMPAGKEYKSWAIIRYPTGKPEKTEAVRIVTEYLAQDYTILAYKLLNVPAGYTYETTWHYK